MGAISSFRISGFGFLSPFAFRHSSFGFLSEPFTAGRATVQRRAGFQPARRARQRERFRSVGVADGGRQDACPPLLFKEGLHSLLRMHWDHEPTLNPSQEGSSAVWPVRYPADPTGGVVQFRSKL